MLKINSLEERFAQRPDYRQLDSYGRVMQKIGWKIIKLKGANLFIRSIGPVAFAKLQRPQNVDLAELVKIQKQHRILGLQLEPGLKMDLSELYAYGFKPTKSHYAYTKSVIFALDGTLAQIMSTFSKTTSYQMRRALKQNVDYEYIPFSNLTATDKAEILKLHQDWSTEKKVMGYDDNFLNAVWEEMSQGTMILARVGGVLHGALFFIAHHHVGMYFYQFTSKRARAGLYIPSGLAFHAIKLAKQVDCDIFDLCSAHDERYPKENLKWRGFTRHKEGYHPTPIYYPQSYARNLISLIG